MPKTTVLQPNQTQFFSSKRLFISKIIVAITSAAVAVMFTFSFGSAFAYTDAEKANIVDSHEKAVKAIQDKYDDNLAALNRDYSATLANPGNVDKDAWKVACDAALDTAKAQLNKELAQAWNELAAKEAAVTDPVGWIISNDALTVEAGYVDVRTALTKLKTNALGDVDTGEAVFDATMTKTLNLVKNYDLSKFVTDDNYNNTGKSSYQTAVDAQNDALKLLASYKYSTNNTVAQIKAVYDITGVGTLGEKESGTFYDAIKNLKTTSAAKTDDAKIAYAKAAVTNDIKSMIEAQRAAELKVQNDIIFAQSIATKPNQKAIDNANEEIANINKKYDNYLKVWTYRLDNGTYKVTTVNDISYIDLYYGDTKVAYFGSFTDGKFVKNANTAAYSWATLTAALPVADATKIVDHVSDLEKEAADLKATIYVDGDVAADVDSALADAVKDTYMLGTLTNHVSTTLTNSILHQRIHQLLGTTCADPDGKNPKTAKVTVNSKKYDNVSQWATNVYSPENTKAVKAIIKDAKDAIMAAKTVADAEAAFVAAYDKYDAVLTTAEQAALFSYKGDLYKKDTAAKAELNAYIDYKVALMDDAIPRVAAALKDYYEDNLLTEVNNAADLDKAVADAKAFVDSLKTLKEIKAEDRALRDKIVALARPVTLEKKADAIALYNEYLAFDKYCTKVGYYNTESDSVAALLGDDVERLASLERDAMAEIVKAIEKDGKVTLDDRENVEALVKAMAAYNDLYPEYEALDISEYKTDKDYKELIFALDVNAANKLIAALPAYGASVAQIKAAKDAVAALGFKGICKLDPTMVTKLNRLEASIGYEVEAIKIKASSKATKGAMTIKWRVVGGNKDAVQGYQVARSTKLKSGFKTMIKTTKMTYKNTKNLKKGTRYYYKVRAYAKAADGTMYYSDWSNKAYRVAK